jgi:hypothetical protein
MTVDEIPSCMWNLNFCLEGEYFCVDFDQIIDEAKHDLKCTTTQRAKDVGGILSELDDANLVES